MEAFDPRHLFPLFGPLEAIDQHHRPSVDPPTNPPSEQALESLLPEPGQLLQVQGGRVEEVEQAVIAGFRQTQAPDQAGDTGQIGAEAEAHQNDDQPEEGGGAGAGRAEGLEGAPKSRPENHPRPGRERRRLDLTCSDTIYMVSDMKTSLRLKHRTANRPSESRSGPSGSAASRQPLPANNVCGNPVAAARPQEPRRQRTLLQVSYVYRGRYSSRFSRRPKPRRSGPSWPTTSGSRPDRKWVRLIPPSG